MASYKVLIRPSAVRELEAVPKRDRKRVADRNEGLGTTPRPVGCEKLSGGDRYKVRQGNYRIVYSVDDDQWVVRVVKAGHRGDVYRRPRGAKGTRASPLRLGSQDSCARNHPELCGVG